jgi:hypothetical protein
MKQMIFGMDSAIQGWEQSGHLYQWMSHHSINTLQATTTNNFIFQVLPNNSDMNASTKPNTAPQLINQVAIQVGAHQEHECASDKQIDSHLDHHSQPSGIHY